MEVQKCPFSKLKLCKSLVASSLTCISPPVRWPPKPPSWPPTIKGNQGLRPDPLSPSFSFLINPRFQLMKMIMTTFAGSNQFQWQLAADRPAHGCACIAKLMLKLFCCLQAGSKALDTHLPSLLLLPQGSSLPRLETSSNHH